MVKQMNRFNTNVTLLLLFAFPLAFLGSAYASCKQDIELQLQIQNSQVAIDPSASHGHHGREASGAIVAEHHASHNAEPVGCDCCETCASICPASGCGNLLIEFFAENLSASGDRHGYSAADSYHDSPAAHPLLRPPIQFTD